MISAGWMQPVVRRVVSHRFLSQGEHTELTASSPIRPVSGTKIPKLTVAASTPSAVGTEHPMMYARNDTFPLSFLSPPRTKLISSLDASEIIPHPVRKANKQPDRICRTCREDQCQYKSGKGDEQQEDRPGSAGRVPCKTRRRRAEPSETRARGTRCR